jgi:hypothetical protein
MAAVFQKSKFRPISDMKASGINKSICTNSFDDLHLDRISHLLDAIRCLKSSNPEEKVIIGTEDVKSFYRNFNLRPCDWSLQLILSKLGIVMDTKVCFGAASALYSRERTV